ncbi:DUF5085 domain-containing protein [Neobacillus muris]|uniref:DUF5085 domain-containing protein n=1 Tax=Neobacillus muris TaxID=2941334 RepID=UPI002041683C|nr:DUF5085 domain-containing protein [Neobacillus muris]
MKIKRSPIRFNNVISYTAICKITEWHQAATELRNSVIENGLYGTGPVIFQVSSLDETAQEAQYTFHIPVNAPVKMAADSPFQFTESLAFDDGLLIRHADLDESIDDSYALLYACAEANQVKLQEPFFNIYLDVYGDGIIDVYAAIVKED